MRRSGIQFLNHWSACFHPRMDRLQAHRDETMSAMSLHKSLTLHAVLHNCIVCKSVCGVSPVKQHNKCGHLCLLLGLQLCLSRSLGLAAVRAPGGAS